MFADPQAENGLSQEAYSFIAGLLSHMNGMAAIANPIVNSYKRLKPGYHARPSCSGPSMITVPRSG